MRKFTFLIFLMTNISAFNQTTDSNKCIIGVFYSPNISYRTLNETWATELLNEREVYKFGNSFGIDFGYKLNKFIGIETGLQFQSRGYQTKEDSPTPEEPDPLIPDKIKFVYHFYYIGIPLKVNFRKDYKKVFFFSSLGIHTNFLLHQDITSISTFDGQTEKYTNNRTADYDKLMLTPVISLGIGYKISQKIDILLSPTFQHDILPVVDAQLDTYLWDFGLNISCLYNI